MVVPTLRRGAAPWLVVGAVVLVSGAVALSSAASQLSALDGLPPRPADAAMAPIGSSPLAPPGDGGYAFLGTQVPSGQPVAWDPCRPVHYVVRPTGEPAGGRALLQEALAKLSAATGLVFVDDGATTEAPSPDREGQQPERYGDRWAPVLVAWSDPVERPELAGGVLAAAGPSSVDGPGTDDERYVSGTVLFDAPDVAQLVAAGRSYEVSAIVLHELGHLVGLAHVPDPYTVMYSRASVPFDGYMAGDLRGLALLGQGRCFDR